MEMTVKVSGLREPENIRAISALAGVGIVSFDFRPESDAYVRMLSSFAGFLPDYSPERRRAMDGRTAVQSKGPLRCGLFADCMPQDIVTRVYNYSLGAVQLCGGEGRTMVDNIVATLSPDIRPGVMVFKEVAVDSPGSFAACREFEGSVSMFVFRHARGGALWPLLAHYGGGTPFLVAGVGPGDAWEARRCGHPMFAGCDLGGAFSTFPGMVSVGLVERFVNDCGT